MASFSFAVPSVIPQDLQLIHNLVGDIPDPVPARKIPSRTEHDEEHGTDSDTDSEKEVEHGILADVDDDEGSGTKRCAPACRSL